MKLTLFIALIGLVTSIDYTIKTQTGFRTNEQTSMDVGISLKAGKKSVNLGDLPNAGSNFNQGKLATFTISSDVDVGTVKKVCATLTARNSNAWKVNTVIVSSSNMGEWHLYNVDDIWLSTDTSEGVAKLKLCSQGIATYRVTTKTATAKHSGSDNIHAKITLFNKKESKNSTSGFLDNPDLDDFESGAVDTFTVPNLRLYPAVRCLVMTADADDAWLIEWIKVKKTFPLPPDGSDPPEFTFTNTAGDWLSSDTTEGKDKYKLCN